MSQEHQESKHVHCFLPVNSTSAKLDAPLTPASKNTLRALNAGKINLLLITSTKRDTPSTNIHVKGLRLLFTDSVDDRKDMESHLIHNIGTRKSGGMNERL